MVPGNIKIYLHFIYHTSQGCQVTLDISRSPIDFQWGSHYNDIILGWMASQIASLTIVYPAVYLGADQGKHESSASLAFVRGIHRGLVNSPHKWPVTRKFFPFDDVIMPEISRVIMTSVTSVWKGHRLFIYFPKQDKDLTITQGECHGCWWHGDGRSQGI